MPRPKRAAKKPITRAYTVFFVPEEEVGGYTAHIPALGIVTEGESLAEAKDMARDAVEGWIEAAQELGRPIPEDVATDQVEVSA